MEIQGKKVNKWMIVGGAAGVAVVLYLYKTHSAAGSASQSAIDPVTGLPTSQDNTVDPVTGLTYLAEAQQYGSVSAAEAQATGLGNVAQGTGIGGTAGYPTSNVGSSNGTSQSFATNAAWAQAAVAGLAGLGYDPPTVAAAIGVYLNQKPLNSSQLPIVQAAVAEFGPPPQGNYPIIPQGTSSAPGVGNKPTSTGHPQLPAPSHVHVSNKNAHEFSLAWNPVKGASGYRVRVSQTNAKVIADFEVPGPGCTVGSNTHPGYTYHVGVQALPGGTGTNITVSLPKK